MHYRLAFNITHDGYVRVTAAAAQGQPVVSAIHLNDQVLSVAIRAAGMAPLQTLRILEAARGARKQPGIEICCEVVELNPRQLDMLCLQRKKIETA
jgi:hypothetical protein